MGSSTVPVLMMAMAPAAIVGHMSHHSSIAALVWLGIVLACAAIRSRASKRLGEPAPANPAAEAGDPGGISHAPAQHRSPGLQA